MSPWWLNPHHVHQLITNSVSLLFAAGQVVSHELKALTANGK